MAFSRTYTPVTLAAIHLSSEVDIQRDLVIFQAISLEKA
jgi:hypothetical protein